MKTKIQTERKASGSAWDELGRKVSEAAKKATGLALHQMEAEAKDIARGRFHNTGRGFGRLAQSIEVHGPVNDGVGKYSGEVGPTVIYGRIQELGGAMHGHPFMHWFGEGGWHKARLVILPPRPYLKPGVEAAMPQIGDILRAEVEKAMSS